MGRWGEGGLGFVAYVLSVAATDRRVFDRINRIGSIGMGGRQNWIATKCTKEHKGGREIFSYGLTRIHADGEMGEGQ